MNIKIEGKKLIALVEKVEKSILDGIKLSVSPVKNGSYLGLVSCDRMTRTEVFEQCETDIQEAKVIILDKIFISVVKSLVSASGDTGLFELKVSDNQVVVCYTASSAASSVPVALSKECTSFEQESPQKAKYKFSVSTSDFIQAIKRGGSAYVTEPCRMACMNNMIAFIPCMNTKGEVGIRVFSTNAKLTNISMADMAISADDSMKDVVDKGEAISPDDSMKDVGWLFNATYLNQILSLLQGDKTDVFIGEKQFLIKNRNDYYTVIAGDNSTLNPNMLQSSYTSFDNKEYSFAVNVKDLKGALEIAMLNPSAMEEYDAKVADFIYENNSLQVMSYTGKNVTTLSTEGGTGTVRFALDISMIKKAIAHMRNNKVIVSGISANSPVYLTDDGKKGRTVIAPFLIREELEKVRTKPQTDSEE